MGYSRVGIGMVVTLLNAVILYTVMYGCVLQCSYVPVHMSHFNYTCKNAVSAQPYVGKLGISLVLFNFLDCNFRLWFKTP